MGRRLLSSPCFIGAISQVCLEILELWVCNVEVAVSFFTQGTQWSYPLLLCEFSDFEHSVSVLSERTVIVMRRKLFCLALYCGVGLWKWEDCYLALFLWRHFKVDGGSISGGCEWKQTGIGFPYRDKLCRVSDNRRFHMHAGLGSFHGTGVKTRPGLWSSGYNLRVLCLQILQDRACFSS